MSYRGGASILSSTSRYSVVPLPPRSRKRQVGVAQLADGIETALGDAPQGERTVLVKVHNDTLAQYRQARRADGVTAGTINKELSCIRRVLNLAARVWRHDNGMSWLNSRPVSSTC